MIRRRVQIVLSNTTYQLMNDVNEYLAKLEEVHGQQLAKVEIEYQAQSPPTLEDGAMPFFTALIYYEFFSPGDMMRESISV